MVEGPCRHQACASFRLLQTAGEPLPEIDTEAIGDCEELVSALLNSGDDLELALRIVTAEEWWFGKAKGACKNRSEMSMQRLIQGLRLEARGTTSKPAS